MLIGILSPVRLVGEGVAASLRACNRGFEPSVVNSIDRLRGRLASGLRMQLVIVDVSHSLSLDGICDFHADYPALPLLALGLSEHEAEIVAHGSAGFIGYFQREDGLEQLSGRIDDALSGRLRCPPEIAGGIMRGLFRGRRDEQSQPRSRLTARELHIEDLIRSGFSNKEIARNLSLSESTVKQHAHSIFCKRGITSRMELVREARQDRWLENARR